MVAKGRPPALVKLLADARARRWSGGLEQAILGTNDPAHIAAVLSEAVTSQLGDPPVEGLFFEVSTALVLGVRLAGGAPVVVKVFQPQCSSGYLRAVRLVQAALAVDGFPAPTPLAGPFPLGRGYAVIDELMPAPDYHERPDADGRRVLAQGLSEFIGRCAVLAREPDLRQPPFPWPPANLWGARVRPEVDLHARPRGAEWIDALGQRGLRLAESGGGSEVLGHADWLPHNVRLDGGAIVAVFDWDSVCVAPEPVFLGKAAVWGPVDDVLEFIDTYEGARGSRLSAEEWRLTLGVAVWMRAFLARWEHSQDLRSTGLRENLAKTGEELLALAILPGTSRTP